MNIQLVVVVFKLILTVDLRLSLPPHASPLLEKQQLPTNVTNPKNRKSPANRNNKSSEGQSGSTKMMALKMMAMKEAQMRKHMMLAKHLIVTQAYRPMCEIE